MAQEPMRTGIPPGRRSYPPIVFAAAAGAVLGALIVGSIWLLSSDGGSGPDVSGSTPDRVGDYARIIDRRQVDTNDLWALRVRTWDRRSAERLSAAYGGAETAVETYVRDGPDERFTLFVVGARAPFPPFVPYQDPAYLQLKRPPEEVREFGAVACVVRNDPIAEGGEDRPDATHVVSCLRTSATATVEIRNVGGGLATNPQKVADLVNDAWAKLT